VTQIEAGIAEPIMEEPNIPLPYITGTWITSIRNFIALHNITLSISDTLQVRLNGPNDACIMDIDKLKGYTTQQQRDINLVQLHLQVITLSDMSQSDGQNIYSSMLKGNRASDKGNISRSKAWPRQPSLPSASQRRLWRRY
jgi:hypothetical protein